MTAFDRTTPRPVRDSQHETSELMMPQHANNLGHVFGGVILSMMDRTSAVSAKQASAMVDALAVRLAQLSGHV